MKQTAIRHERCAKGTKLVEERIKPGVKAVKILLLYALSMIFLVCWGCATAKSKGNEALQPAPAVITGIEIQDNLLTIKADKPFIYTIYKPGDPYKMVIDLPDVTLGTFNKKIVSHKNGITEITPTQIDSPSLMARLELLLQNPSVIDQTYKSNVLTVTVKEEPSMQKAESPRDVKITELLMDPETSPKKAMDPVVSVAPSERLVNLRTTPLPNATEISSIAFEQGRGAVKLVIKGNGSMIPNVFPLDDRIVIDISDVVLNTMLPDAVVSPVKGIRSGKHDDKVRLVLDLKEQTSFDVSAIGDSIIVTMKGPGTGDAGVLMANAPSAMDETGPEAEETKVSPELTGSKCADFLAGKENVNFDFQDQDIVPILRLFADISSCNLFVHPEVKGKATMKFRDVPWIKALDTILKTFSLDKSVEGNIIRIAPNSVFAKESEEKVKVIEAQVKAEPLETKIYSISYADVAIVESAIRSSKILTSRGSISVDKRTSSMLVKDVATVFPEVENILATLDKPTPQVLVEARIVEVNTNSERDIGIQWGVNFQTPNTLASAGGLNGVPQVSSGPFTGKNYLVDFPSKSAGPLSGSGFAFGIINPQRTIGLDMQLSAIETMGNLKVISNPKILTVDNGKAKILQGKSVPVRKLTTEGTVSTEFKDVTLELNVVPHITPDKSISMAIEIKKEELDPTVPSVEGVPGTDKKEANTNVIIKDGETIVIGGMYKVTTNESESGVPGLMKIPLLGWLFKSNTVTSGTSELLIFITPRILDKP
jgi:type IV pilus assembly protein PilQ